MRVHFSTDGLAPRDRVRFWCDHFAKQVHSFTPGEIPDANAFRAEAVGQVTGGFGLLDIETGLERAKRTHADVLRDKTEAVFIRRFRRPLIWRAAPRSTRVDLEHEPGDFCVSSTEWQFDAEFKGAASFRMLIIPQVVLSPLLAGGRLARPFRLPASSPLGSLLGAAIDAANAQVPLLSDELGEAVLRNLSGLVALACGASDEGAARGREFVAGKPTRRGQAIRRSASGRPGLDAGRRRCRGRHLSAPAASVVRAEREQFRAIRVAPEAAQVPRRDRRRDRPRPVCHRHCLRLGVQQHGDVLSCVRKRVWCVARSLAPGVAPRRLNGRALVRDWRDKRVEP